MYTVSARAAAATCFNKLTRHHFNCASSLRCSCKSSERLSLLSSSSLLSRRRRRSRRLPSQPVTLTGDSLFRSQGGFFRQADSHLPASHSLTHSMNAFILRVFLAVCVSLVNYRSTCSRCGENLFLTVVPRDVYFIVRGIATDGQL